MMALPAPQSPADKAAMRQRRRWLARRRCLRALRATITSLVLAMPFACFGLVLCCHMPFGLQTTIPNFINISVALIFFRAIWIFASEIRFSPLYSILPLIVYALLQVSPWPNDTWKVNWEFYFSQFYTDRMEVIRHIKQGEFQELDKSEGKIDLPQKFKHTSFPHGSVEYSRINGKYTLFFSTDLDGIPSTGFEYSDDEGKEYFATINPSYKSTMITPNWVFITY
ncbi:hypothetical protein [Desulfovibrio sp. TomC]|uniref:hypothetical protein n=1 Tax=Desulfovibrio sp. TomC TaxID=1562888 RepID=UPI0012E31CAB|nr:hypothetical protein [Desulfovibrio sp. TomC]